MHEDTSRRGRTQERRLRTQGVAREGVPGRCGRRVFVSIGLGNGASHIPRRLMDAASNRANRFVGTATRLDRASRTVELASPIFDRAVLRDMGARGLE